ncbi:lipopolysaccharide transport system permease protein [Neorhodopirellula lusitana]|uniref:Transport permease protein n=1 Tax=Neorhodopirellula lusitana TaxID=445327 RepID=A0ABY1PU90_9BACT|nr:ABC transporter permease [Neorhodopirellula lusitana]SMP44099.1 lipopolysaccharide transport system permease protein [Neorhodopirellula lusitana]
MSTSNVKSSGLGLSDWEQDALDARNAKRCGAEMPVTRIQSKSDWQAIDFAELYVYRDLFRYLVRREIKVRYAQSAIGVGWAILQPLFTMLVFTVIFGRLAKVGSDGAPYALFSFAGLVPWMFFSNAVTDGVNGLIGGASMMSKVYFPRMFMPLAANAARLIDFGVASIVMAGLMVWYGVLPNAGALALPWILAMMFLTASGVTLWLSTFAIQYRDVKHAMGFVVQILMYAAPVVYPASLIPEAYQRVYAINPMVGVIEGLRSGWLGTRVLPWDLLLIGSVSAILLFVTGVSYFNAKQRVFADLA